MIEPITSPASTRKFSRRIVDFARISVASAAILVVVRLYEQVIAGAAHRIPLSDPIAWLRAFGSDLATAAWVALLLAVPILALGFVVPNAARLMHRAAVFVVIVLSVPLAQYFAVTGVPLGADLFGYSLHDIRETVGSSGGVSIAFVVAMLVFVFTAWYVPRRALRLPWKPPFTSAAGVCVLLGVAVPSLLTPPVSVFRTEGAALAAVNKTGWFVQRSLSAGINKWRDAREAAGLSGYPLMHPVKYEDVLGPQFALGNAKPNLVFVIVEGLGRDFTGPNAMYGGFTPFLDSLTQRGLTWDNFLSTSGRTFGILPSLLGSLPFGPSGFMELGDEMPAHASLITLLRNAGYTSNYFTGTNGAFDRIDVFMDRQGTDRFVDAAGYGPSYTKAPTEPGGESWGYPDGALFQRSLELLDASSTVPRVDVYLTISTHEPFIPPNEPQYRDRFERRLSELRVDDATRARLRASQGVFESLLYTDDALRAFFAAYERRPDFARTIFFVTGDHRLIPVPASNRLARYHVPFIVYSPMLRAPHHVAAVSSHFDVLPSLMAMLRTRYGVAAPDSAPWIGIGLDTSRAFGAAHALPLMRTKNELEDYFTGTAYLSHGQLFAVDSTFGITESHDDATAPTQALRRFRAMNTFATTRDRLAPAGGMGVTPVPDRAALAAQDSAYHAQHLEGRTPEQAFAAARDLAAAKDYATARLVLRRLLREAPSYHDARALLGRTYAWEQRFDEARDILDDLVRRAPSYPDGLAARAEVDIFRGQGATALAIVTRGLSEFPRDPALLYAKARALELVGDKAMALRTLDELRRVAPSNPEAEALRRRIAGS